MCARPGAFSPTGKCKRILRNALNKDYETALYYNQPGRSAYLKLRYRPVQT